MSKGFAPLLAGKVDFDKLTYPLYGSPKLDGIRAMVRDGAVVSRKLLPIPNQQIQEILGRQKFNNLDGELIFGKPMDEGVYHRTNSFVMSRDKVSPEWCFHVFDHFASPDTAYRDRYTLAESVADRSNTMFVRPLRQTILHSRAEVDVFEENCVSVGYEGIMLRSMDGAYKYGRSTTNEGTLLKVKRFEDSEAIVIRVEEEMHNGNVAGKDELGRTKRSTAKAGKTGKGTMGALVVKDLKTGVEFNIGSGFTAAQRMETWAPNDIVKYKFFPVGVKMKPRHPIFVGRRDSIDT